LAIFLPRRIAMWKCLWRHSGGCARISLFSYKDPDAPIATKRNAKDWKRIQAELQQLRTTVVIARATGE
jgi:hypothetical protein